MKRRAKPRAMGMRTAKKDDEPCPVRVKTDSLISAPYSVEINDIPASLDLGQSADGFRRMICDRFDVLYEDGAKSGPVMAMSLPPFSSGSAIGASILPRLSCTSRRARRCGSQPGAEIFDWYRSTCDERVN